MIIVTSTPSELASVVDIVDRNVVSNLDLSQETVYPIETIPDLFKAVAPSTGALRRSFSSFSAASVANAAAVNTVFGVLSEGLWYLSWTIQYVSNYAQLSVSGFNLSLSPIDGTQAAVFVTFAPVVGANLVVYGGVKLLLDRDAELAFFLLNNGVGQAHSANVSVTGEKYL